jgi:hypothetical protein
VETATFVKTCANQGKKSRLKTKKNRTCRWYDDTTFIIYLYDFLVNLDYFFFVVVCTSFHESCGFHQICSPYYNRCFILNYTDGQNSLSTSIWCAKSDFWHSSTAHIHAHHTLHFLVAPRTLASNDDCKCL